MTLGAIFEERDNVSKFGTIPTRKDLLNSFANDELISLAHSFNNLPGIPSGPLALSTFNVFS